MKSTLTTVAAIVLVTLATPAVAQDNEVATARSAEGGPRLARLIDDGTGSRRTTGTVAEFAELTGPYVAVGVGAVDSTGFANDTAGLETGVQLQLGYEFSSQTAIETGIVGLYTDVEIADDGQGTQTRVTSLDPGGFTLAAKRFVPLDGGFRPFALAGVGVYSPAYGDSGQWRSAVDLGLGAEYRLDETLAVGGRWVYDLFVAESDSSRSSDAWSMVGTVAFLM